MIPGDIDERSAAAVRELGFATTDGELSARLPVSSSFLCQVIYFRNVPHEKGAVSLYPERHLDAD